MENISRSRKLVPAVANQKEGKSKKFHNCRPVNQTCTLCSHAAKPTKTPEGGHITERGFMERPVWASQRSIVLAEHSFLNITTIKLREKMRPCASLDFWETLGSVLRRILSSKMEASETSCNCPAIEIYQVTEPILCAKSCAHRDG